jgi:cysteinyl-tRNA synthetase
MLRIYNTLSRKIEEFKPINPPYVGMYTCGITAYDHTHIGHMRTYVNTDLLRRTLEYNGFLVKQVENVTDVGHLSSDADTGEDKLQKKAKKERKTAWEIAKIYAKEFFEVMDKLNVLKPHIIAYATDHIKEMIELIKKLEEKGFTYKISGDGIYFDTAKLADYGKLACMPRDKILAGARVEMVFGKRNPTDFALWKFSPKNQKRDMEWDSPWGVGFPGWHIECSAMAMKYLGETFDIHTGGIDHIPIHHTNEIAQAEAATGKPFVKYWFHNEFMMVEGKKMSKSLGNFFWIKDVEDKGFEPLALRYLFLTSHYRLKMNFTWEGLKAAQTAYWRLKEMVRGWRKGREIISEVDLGKIENFRRKFQEKINNDLNIPEALAVVWEMAKSNIPDPDKLDLILDFDKVLGLDLEKSLKDQEREAIPQEIMEMVKKREYLRKQKKWDEADRIRKEIENLGFIIEDTPSGPVIKRKIGILEKAG